MPQTEVKATEIPKAIKDAIQFAIRDAAHLSFDAEWDDPKYLNRNEWQRFANGLVGVVDELAADAIQENAQLRDGALAARDRAEALTLEVENKVKVLEEQVQAAKDLNEAQIAGYWELKEQLVGANAEVVRLTTELANVRAELEAAQDPTV